MKVCWALILVGLLGTAGSGETFGQDFKSAYYASLYDQADGSINPDVVSIATFSQKLTTKRKHFRRDQDFLKFVFDRTHQRFLKQYVEYAGFSELFGKKRAYNCLTGTALFALVLENLRVNYRIIETNYHIFVMVQSAEGPVLLETTDKVNGFVASTDAIAQRIRAYKQNKPTASNSAKVYYRYATSIYNEVNLDQLLGLMHYNFSVVAYNQRDLPAAINHLGKALELHPSPRIEEFSRIIMLSVIQSNLEEPVKEKYLKNLQALRKKQLAVTASANSAY